MSKAAPTLHDRLVLRAYQWLRNRPVGNWDQVEKCKPVFAEMVTVAGTTPDVIGWSRGRSRLIEVKTSRSDFLADRNKIHRILPEYAMGRLRWYMVPEGLLGPEDLPPEWGLLYVKGLRVREVVPAVDRVLPPIAQEQEMIMLSSAIARLLVGSQFYAKTGRWEPWVEREARQRVGSNSGDVEVGSESGGSPGGDLGLDVSDDDDPGDPG